MSGWKDCVVSLIDLVGVKKMAWGRKGQASGAMQSMHAEVVAAMNAGLQLHSHAYVWNDSVLLLAFLDESHRPEPILREVEGLKRRLEHLGKNYAIAIQGQVFPDLALNAPSKRPARTTVIRASSFAMANCFHVEECIGRRLRKPWYVDSRLAGKILTTQTFVKKSIDLLPGPNTREIFVYDGYLWRDGPNQKSQDGRLSRVSRVTRGPRLKAARRK